MLEVAGGILLLFLSPHAIEHLARMLTAHELSQDPHDLIARYLLHTTSHLTTGTTLLGAIYLLSNGASKLVLVVLVLRGKLLAYLWMIALLLALIGYQLCRLTAVSEVISSPRLAPETNAVVFGRSVLLLPGLPMTWHADLLLGWRGRTRLALAIGSGAGPAFPIGRTARDRCRGTRRDHAVHAVMG